MDFSSSYITPSNGRLGRKTGKFLHYSSRVVNNTGFGIRQF
jgi:hypothetical protein